MTTAAILVVYSEAFADTAIQVFTDLVRRIDPQAQLIVVNNNARLQLKPYDHVRVLSGSNELHEFGAWQTGIDHLRQQAGVAALRTLVLANDTFCHYRAMGALEQGAFVRATRATARTHRAAACGELSYAPNDQAFGILGVRMSRWIATYLFALNRSALEALDWQIHPGLAEVARWAPCGPTEDSFFSQEMEAGLRQRFGGWLFGRDGLPRWRRWAPLSPENHAQMRGKAHAMVCELLLTARLLQRGARLRSMFHLPLIYPLRRLLQRP